MTTIIFMIAVILLFLFLLIIFFKGYHYENPTMSVHKKCSSILKKLDDLEKVASSLEREETIKRFSCKRSLKQNDISAAQVKAKRCIELRKQIQLYLSMCKRVRFFVGQVNLVIEQKDKARKELLQLVNPIAEGVSSMNFGLVELYLESFEEIFQEELKQHVKELEPVSYMDAFRIVTESEINNFLKEMNDEAKEDEKEFLFKTEFPVELRSIKKKESLQ